MHHLKLHHIVHGKFIKKIGGFVQVRSKGLPKLSQLRTRTNLIGNGIPAHKKIYENEVNIGGKIAHKRIKPLSYKF